jgi:chromate transporter
LILGGLSFILPATLIVLILSWIYVRYGTAPEAGWLLYGIKPVVVAIIVQALYILGTKALKSRAVVLIALLVFVLYFLGVNEILLLFGAGLLYMVLSNFRNLRKMSPAVLLSFGTVGLAQAAIPFSLPLLFLNFLKIGSVLYGSGYVLIAFLRSDFVLRLGWITDQQLIDAVAIGQVTPGPLFTAATFIGYILAGIPGALLATLGIFLPAFVFVAISNPLIPKIRSSPWAGSLLDGVNASALGLMAAVTFQLGVAALKDFYTALIAITSLVLLIRYKINSTWLIAGGAAAGFIISFFLK